MIDSYARTQQYVSGGIVVAVIKRGVDAGSARLPLFVLIAPYASNVVYWCSAISFFRDCPPDRQLPYKLNVYSILYIYIIVQELCESRGGRPGLSVLTSLLVSVDVKIYCLSLIHI